MKEVGPEEAIPDEALFDGFRRGNERDFETLLRRYEGPLFSFLYRQTGDIQEAEDLFQETWTRVYRSVNRFEEERRFSPWLYKIAYRLSVDSYRRRRRERTKTPGREEEGPSADARDLAADREFHQRVRELVGSLEGELRSVVILKHYQGLSYEEIAEVLACPVGTVKSRMHRAISLLRKKAESDGLMGRKKP